MRIKLTIVQRLVLGFGILAAAVIINSIRVYVTLNQNIKKNDENTTIHNPSVYNLHDLFALISNSEMLIKNWVYIDTKGEITANKRKLINLHNVDFPRIADTLNVISSNWLPEDVIEFEYIQTMIQDTLFEKHKEIMNTLNSFEAYQEDPEALILAEMQLAEDGEIIVYTQIVNERLNAFLEKHKKHANQVVSETKENFNQFLSNTLIVGIVSILVAFLTALFTIRSLTVPLAELKNVLIQMSNGVLPKRKLSEGKDEIGEMVKALNNLTENLKKTIRFSLEIGKGNFNTEFKPLSTNDDLGNSLLNMRENLIQANAEQDKRKQEEEDRHWFSRGIAQFSEILRMYNSDFNELSYKLVTELVKYVEANQSGIFVVNTDNEEDTYLELTGSFAYERRKYANKRIEIGEGLVGACFKEKETMFLTEIPNGYIQITSGLGKANPRCIMITPLKVNEEVFGVLEIASFDIFTQVQQNFIEKIAENIASTISYMKVNIRTAKLLADSQQKSEMLSQQEEEMRQNMEEIQATQEESERHLNEFSRQLTAISNAVFMFECSIEGVIAKVNDNILKTFMIRVDEIVGKNLREILIDSQKEDFQFEFEKIMNGENISISVHWVTHTIKEMGMVFTLFPVYDVYNTYIEYIIGISNETKEIR